MAYVRTCVLLVLYFHVHGAMRRFQQVILHKASLASKYFLVPTAIDVPKKDCWRGGDEIRKSEAKHLTKKKCDHYCQMKIKKIRNVSYKNIYEPLKNPLEFVLFFLKHLSKGRSRRVPCPDSENSVSIRQWSRRQTDNLDTWSICSSWHFFTKFALILLQNYG